MLKPKMDEMFEPDTVADYHHGLEMLEKGTASSDLQQRARRYIDRLEKILKKLPTEMVIHLSSDDVTVEATKVYRGNDSQKMMDAIEVDLAAMREPAGSA